MKFFIIGALVAIASAIQVRPGKATICLSQWDCETSQTCQRIDASHSVCVAKKH